MKPKEGPEIGAYQPKPVRVMKARKTRYDLAIEGKSAAED